MSMEETVTARKRLFGVIIGNPPYQDERVGGRKQLPPVYHKFMDAAYGLSDKTMLITPARFLFDAGATPKMWNRKMLNDEHLKVVKYVQCSEEVFHGTDIKGGVAVTYRDMDKVLGPIGVFTPNQTLTGIVEKVWSHSQPALNSIISSMGTYRLSDKAFFECPSLYTLQSMGHESDSDSGTVFKKIASHAFSKLEDVVFFEDKPADTDEYVQFIGMSDSKRVWRWIKRKYITEPADFDAYKVIFPVANGSGAIGEVLSTPLIGTPLIGHTETFIAAGPFTTQSQAEACLSYVKTKFARAMLGVLKITQNNTASTWAKVPLQDFTDKSDIDWTQSVADIDRQLYKKYHLSQDEIDFIETHVKEMP